MAILNHDWREPALESSRTDTMFYSPFIPHMLYQYPFSGAFMTDFFKNTP